MRGLIYKDFQIMKNNAKVMLAASAIVCMILFADQAGSMFVVNYIGFFTTILALNTLSYDDMNHGMCSILSLPIKRSTYVAEKYVFAIGVGLFGWLFAIALVTLIQVPKGIFEMQEMLAGYGAGFLAVCVLAAVMIPVQLKFGAENARIAIFAVIIAVVLIFYGVERLAKMLGFHLEDMIQALAEENLTVTILAAAAAFFVILLLSVGISIMIVKKKEY